MDNPRVVAIGASAEGDSHSHNCKSRSSFSISIKMSATVMCFKDINFFFVQLFKKNPPAYGDPLFQSGLLLPPFEKGRVGEGFAFIYAQPALFMHNLRKGRQRIQNCFAVTLGQNTAIQQTNFSGVSFSAQQTPARLN